MHIHHSKYTFGDTVWCICQDESEFYVMGVIVEKIYFTKNKEPSYLFTNRFLLPEKELYETKEAAELVLTAQ